MKNQKGSAKIVLIVLGVIFGLFLLATISVYSYLNGLRSVSVQKENQLNAQYLDNQNRLSEYVSGFYEQLGLANLKSEKMDQIISNAVSGRYGDDGFSSDGAFFAAVKEAYPDLAGLDIYDKIADYVKAKRAEFRGVQSKLLDMINSYDAWRQDGMTQSWVIKNILNIPSNRLVAQIGDIEYYGEEALRQMKKIVLAGQAVEAFKSGVMAPLSVK